MSRWEIGEGQELIPAGLLYQKDTDFKTLPSQLRGRHENGEQTNSYLTYPTSFTLFFLFVFFTTQAMWSKLGIDLSIRKQRQRFIHETEEGHLAGTCTILREGRRACVVLDPGVISDAR